MSTVHMLTCTLINCYDALRMDPLVRSLIAPEAKSSAARDPISFRDRWWLTNAALAASLLWLSFFIAFGCIGACVTTYFTEHRRMPSARTCSPSSALWSRLRRSRVKKKNCANLKSLRNDFFFSFFFHIGENLIIKTLKRNYSSSF